MNPKVITKKDVELETLKKFLKNQGGNFNEELAELGKQEPVDIWYSGTSYQITEGDKEEAHRRHKAVSKDGSYSTIRDISNIAETLLRGTLTKKSTRSDPDTVLLIDAMSTGGLSWDALSKELSLWATNNKHLCNGWKAIYCVYREKNIKLNF